MNNTDYTERGLTVELSGDAVDVAGGHAVIKAGPKAYDVFPDPWMGVVLADTEGVN